jgi:anti-anti-sigma regulatory factor
VWWCVAMLRPRVREAERAFATPMTIEPVVPFETITTYEGTDAYFALHGRVENMAVFELGASLDAVIDRHPTSIELDLTHLDFMGPTGFVALANAEKRLAEMGAKLTIRSPSELINRLLSIMEVAEVSRLIGQALSDDGRSVAQQLGEMPTLSLGGVHRDSIDEFRKVTALAGDPDIVDGALRLVVELAHGLVEGADGVSVSLRRHGRLATVAASDQIVMAMDADQYSTGEGPCVDASLKGRSFHAEALDTETRWPAFTPQARGLGIKAILSSPLLTYEEPVGALNIYSRRAAAFDAQAQAAAAVFAKKASVILSNAGAGTSDTQMAFRFQESLQSRRVITLATGVVMEREGIEENEAFTQLLRLSLTHGETLRGEAEAMVRPSLQPQLGTEAELNE